MPKMLKSGCLIAKSFLVLILAMGIMSCEKRSSKRSQCVDNLIYIETLKKEWANERGKSSNDIPTWDDLRPFPDRWSNNIPVCPSGGTYKLNRVGETPTCSNGGLGHSL